MSWIYVGLLAGSLVTSTHDSKEACEGRGVTLKEKGVSGQCIVNLPGNVTSNNTLGSTCLKTNNTWGAC